MQPSIISSRVTGGFAALLVMLVLVFIASVRGAARLAGLDSAVGRARDVLEEIAVTRNSLREVETTRRGYLLTHHGEFGRPRDVAVGAHPDGGTIVAEQIRGLVTELEDTERERLRDHEAEANARTMKVIRGFGTVALIALLLLGTAYYILDRDAAVHAAVLEELRMYSRSAASAKNASHSEAPSRRG